MIKDILRNNIKEITPYSSARSEFTNTSGDMIYMDANENPYGSVGGTFLNRYPDPFQIELKSMISKIKDISIENIFLGNGSDEAIDIIIRAVCIPELDNIITLSPTYGMYKVCADINDIKTKEISLLEDFSVDINSIIENINTNTKAIFLCSPNNPTGGSIVFSDVKRLLNKFKGLVIIDEAYIEFSEKESYLSCINNFDNLIVLQTFSKAWGLSGIRLGCAYSNAKTIEVMNKIKLPYNINSCTQEIAKQALKDTNSVDIFVRNIKEQKAILQYQLSKFACVDKVYNSDANFLLVKVDNANKLYSHLISEGIVIRNRTNIEGLENCIRISIGTAEDNQKLLKAIYNYNQTNIEI